MILFHHHDWEDITTPWNHLSVTHLQCLKCGKIVSAFTQKYERSTQGRHDNLSEVETPEERKKRLSDEK